MLTIQEYVKAESLEQAYELNQKKTNRIIGGMLWMKMSPLNIKTAIDLSGLGLDQIEETQEEFRIGCMVSLRQLDTHPGLEAYTGGSMKESLRHIVGVQFRNLATVGGSIYGRFGFSDVLTEFMALGAEVELFHGGRMPLEEFAKLPYDKDILVGLILKKVPQDSVYLSMRNTRTDFPVLTCAVSRREGMTGAFIGARPGRAVAVYDRAGLLKSGITDAAAREFAAYAAEQTVTGSNKRAQAEYRTHLIRVLTRRACQQLGGETK